MDRLVAAFETIAEEIKAIRQSVDRLQDDFAWAFDNQAFSREPIPPSVMPFTSMALHPLAEDFGERINAVTPEPAASTSPGTSAQASRGRQGELWS